MLMSASLVVDTLHLYIESITETVQKHARML